MTLLSHLLALGVWPALPVTGGWVFAMHRGTSFRMIPTPARFALACALGFCVWSAPMLSFAVVGVYRGDVFGVVGWAVTFAAVIAGWRSGGRVSAPDLIPRSGWDRVLAVGLAGAAVLYLGFPTEAIWTGRDQDVYAIQGVYVARHGGLDVPYPWPAWADGLFSDAFLHFRGLYETRPMMTAQFGHVVQVWLAQAFSGLDQIGLYRLNGVLALLALGAFYGVCREVVPAPYATVAMLIAAFNPGQLWVARNTLSEIAAQLLVWSGLLLLVRALRRGERGLALSAGVFFGTAVFVRIDMLLLLALLLAAHLGWRVAVPADSTGGEDVWRALYASVVPLVGLAGLYYAVFSAPYFASLAPSLRLIGLATLASAGFLLVARGPLLRIARGATTAPYALLPAGAAVLTLAAWAYWVRPYVPPFATVGNPGGYLNGRRTYDEETLLNLARYLSPVVVWGAVFGWLLGARNALRRGAPHLLPLLVIIGGFGGLYIWRQSISPDHFFAIRRFVPVVLPGFALLSAAAAWWVAGRLPAPWRVLIPALAGTVAPGFVGVAGARYYLHAEHAGSFAQYAAVASALPPGQLVIANARGGTGQLGVLTPLYMAFDRPIVPVNLRRRNARDALDAWADVRVREGHSAWVLSFDPLRLGNRRSEHVRTFRLTSTFAAMSARPLPMSGARSRIELRLYRVGARRVESRDGGQAPRPTGTPVVRRGG